MTRDEVKRILLEGSAEDRMRVSRSALPLFYYVVPRVYSDWQANDLEYILDLPWECSTLIDRLIDCGHAEQCYYVIRKGLTSGEELCGFKSPAKAFELAIHFVDARSRLIIEHYIDCQLTPGTLGRIGAKVGLLTHDQAIQAQAWLMTEDLTWTT
jgi:hypothetical protein